MERKLKISIPEPCDEDWNKMAPNATGRFCNSCSKSVVDFTKMAPTEIQNYFIENQGKKVCGQFKNEQLDTIIIQIPCKVLFSPMQFHRMFMMALLISMGTTLFSCQNSSGEQQKIDSVEVINNDENYTILGMPLPKRDSIEIKIDTNLVYSQSEIDINPIYKGDINKFRKYVFSNLKIPKEAKYNSIDMFVMFIVEIDGSLSNIKTLRSDNEKLNSEIVSIFKSSVKWKPGEINGVKVRSSYMFPIHIAPSKPE